MRGEAGRWESGVRSDHVGARCGRALIVTGLLLAGACGCSRAGFVQTVAVRSVHTDSFGSFRRMGALEAVSAVSKRSTWAVGWTVGDRTLIVRWNGRSWRRVPGSGISRFGSLYSVAAVSAGDAWAVGSAGAYGRPHALTEHWDGVSWKRVPTRLSAGGSLYGVAALSARDAWAVGQVGNRALVMHWNGRFWAHPAIPGLPQGLLFGVAAVSASKVWAVGYAGRTAISGKALVEYWNGNHWQRVATHLPNGVSALTAVSAISSRDVWAVGVADNNRTLTLLWDGSSWHLVPSPCSRPCELNSVAAVSAGSAWAVGSSGQRTLVLRWNGQNWRRVFSPTPASGGYLSGVAVFSPRSVWAVGRTNFGAISDSPATIIEHWNGAAWH